MKIINSFVFIFVLLFVFNTNAIKLSEDEKYSIEEKPEWYSIDSNFAVSPGKISDALGWGYYKNEILKDGWGKLYVEMNKFMTPENSSIYYEATGYLEGYLTWSTTWNYSQAYFQNYMNGTNESDIPTPLVEFLKINYDWMTSTFSNRDESVYDTQVSNVIYQFEGFARGYQQAADSDKQLTTLQLLLLQYAGDLEDVAGYLEFEMAQNKTEYTNRVKSLKEIETLFAVKGRCSGLVRITPDYGELFISHTTWGSYFTAGYRIFKRIIIPDPTVPGTEILFASYAGVLTSDDDFFMIPSTEMVIIETTNDILNTSLYQYVTPNSLLYFVRSIIANRLSNTAQEWTNNFIQYNSGTYSNQWMIVDYKLFTPYQPLQPNTFWIIEQLPGGFMSADMTDVLALGNWPSFNRPFFPEIYDAMGYSYYEKLYGDIISYDLNPRSKMFRRDVPSVMSLDGMQQIMTQNNYKSDPFSGGFPGNAIAARYDLGSGPAEPLSWSFIGLHGAIDSKITSYSLLQQNQAIAINGMTVTPDCPPFTWNSNWSTVSAHYGSPETFDFDWISITITDK
ncbi:hypothetical protein ACTFIW_005107 [Dictyostelium discoideum]